MAKNITNKIRAIRITKIIAVFLVITIFANILNLFTFVKPAKAVDASDHMLLFWNDDCTSPPTGWSVVSDADGEEFYDATNGGLFPRGNSSYARNAGGALTHTHSGTGSSTAATATDRKTAAGSTHNSDTHTHPVTVDSVSNISNLPTYRNLCVIKNTGIPNGNSAIPSGAIAIFDAAVPGANWSDVSGYFTGGFRYIRGNSSAGGVGGSDAHQGTSHSVSATLTGVAGTIAASGSTANRSSLANHTHTASGTSSAPGTQPPYITIILGKATANTAIPNGMIAMFDDTDSSVGFSVAGWTRLSDSGGPFYQKLLSPTGSYGSTGGANQHSHIDINATSSTSASDVGGSGSGTIPGHAHPTTLTLADGTNTNLPPYTNVVIAKKQTVTTTLSTDAGSYPTLGETISVSTTVNNYHASTALNDKYIDAVIFIDGDADGQPDAGETYITNGCAGSASWASGNYTHQNTNVDTAASGSANDNWTCVNTNFPSNTTYTIWTRWWDSTSYAYNIYYEKSVTFTSIPTLTEILFLILVGSAVFLGVKMGVIKLKKEKKSDPKNTLIPPKNSAPLAPDKTHQNLPRRSIDGITSREKRK